MNRKTVKAIDVYFHHRPQLTKPQKLLLGGVAVDHTIIPFLDSTVEEMKRLKENDQIAANALCDAWNEIKALKKEYKKGDTIINSDTKQVLIHINEDGTVLIDTHKANIEMSIDGELIINNAKIIEGK